MNTTDPTKIGHPFEDEVRRIENRISEYLETSGAQLDSDSFDDVALELTVGDLRHIAAALNDYNGGRAAIDHVDDVKSRADAAREEADA